MLHLLAKLTNQKTNLDEPVKMSLIPGNPIPIAQRHNTSRACFCEATGKEVQVWLEQRSARIPLVAALHRISKSTAVKSARIRKT
jgi:hypothetical protein